jgi:hypothetical protein
MDLKSGVRKIGAEPDFHGSISDASQALLIQPGYLKAYTVRISAKKRMGDQSGAEKDWKELKFYAEEADRNMKLRRSLAMGTIN